MLLSHPATCPQRKARPSPTAQAPRPYKASFFQLFLDLKFPSMPLPSRFLPFVLPSLPKSLSSLLLKVKQLGRVSSTGGGSSLAPSCADKDARSLAPSPLPPVDATPCCSCSSCRRCCSCCYCRDPKAQRTSDARWFTWLLSSSVASAAEGGVAGGSSGGGGGGSGHAKSCGRCGGGFSIFFNKRVRCGGCDLAVCRKCAPWSAADKAYVCGVCSQPAPPTQTEPESPNTQADAAQLKEVEENVRAHIEALVEGQVGGPLDHVNAVPNLAHSKARDLFARYHGALSGDITALKYSLQMSILNRPLPPEDLPTSRHAHLSERIKSVKEAMILPIQNEAYDPAASPETPVEDFNSHTYEDILATAILNKVLESCEGERPDEVTIEVSHEVTSTDTDSGMSGGAKESRRGRLKRGELSEGGSEGSEERSLTPPRRSSRRPPTVSPDQGVVTDDSWAQAAAGDGPPLQFKIEEHVEEITTHHLTDDDHDLDDLDDEEVSDSGGSWRGSRCSLDDTRERRRREKVTRTATVAEDALLPSLNIPLPDPSHLASRRVSFPELGADIVHDSCSDTDCCQVEPGDMVMDNDTWEENWLFRRQRLVPGGGAGGSIAAIHDPVTMLIPNPEAHVLPTVGNRDVDELSELSEQHSLGSGEPWSTSESEGEGEGEDSFLHQQASKELSALAGEIVAEFGQKDQEYTVDYSVPSRVSRSSGAMTSPPHAPSHRLPPGDSPTRASHPQYMDRGRREGPRGFDQGEVEDAERSPGRYDTPRSDSDGRCDAERPVPKPRKLSLATPSPAKPSAKSTAQYLPSPSEDLSILSPPLEVPNPKVAPPSSDTVWFVAGPEDCTVTQGRTLRLVCQVNTKRPMGLSWYHNGALIPSGGRDHWQWRQGSYHHLHVFATTHDTAGVYAAAAYTANTCVWAFCRVQHKSSSRPQKRPSFTKGLSDVVAEEGSEVTLQCQVTGHPEPRVTFSRGSEKLESSSKVFIESDQYGTWTVKLSEWAQHDSGEIVASASNFMGTVATRCRVRIVPEGTPIPRDETDSRRSISSSSKADHPSAPGRRHGSHKARSSGQATTNKHSAPASANTSPHRVPQDPLTTSSGVTTDADDLDEILQVPTKPGRRPKTRGSACPSAVDSQHDSRADATAAERDRRELVRQASAWIDSEDDRDEDEDNDDGVSEQGLHGRSVTLGPLGSSSVMVEGEGGFGSEDDGDGAKETEFLPKDPSASKGSSSPLCQEARNAAFIGLESSLVSPQNALTLDLDYCPSSHDDDSSSSSSSDEDAPTLPRNPPPLGPSPSSPIKATSPTSPLGSHAPPLSSVSPHASGAPSQHLTEHEDDPLAEHEAEAVTASTPQPGTIAEREHRKWEAAIPLANNPYAPERLVQRLSHSRSSSTTHIPRALRVDFPEDSPKDLDPSLRAGVPPQADLKRYSRDYYVATSASNSGWQRSPQAQHISQQPQPRAFQPQLANGHYVSTSRSTSDLVSSQVHIRLTAGVSESACDLKKAYPEGATEDLLQEEEEDSSQSQEGGAIRASRRTDWKDELRDIQAARVEREVARFQRTIDETQRRWEENYARAAPRSAPATGHSDSSTEGLHNPRPAAYLVPPRHDLWRTVSVDTLGEPARDRTTLQPLLRHTSVDNLRPSTKVSNLSPLGPNPRQNSMNTVSSLSNINLSNNCGGSKAAPSYQPQPAHGQSVESMSGYSDGESHGDGNDSDVSTSTPDKVPVLPSVRKLASKFDVASRERVNDLDKHGKDGSLAFNGKKNIFIEKSSPTDPPYIRNLTNNLNKRTEKTYNVKEVHSLTARCVPRRFREGLKEHPANGHMTSKTQPTHTCPSPRRDAPSPEHLGIPWGPVAIPVRPTQVHGDTSDDSSAPPGSPRRVPRRRSGGRRDTPGWYARPECGSLTDPAVPVAADSVC